MQIYDTKPKRRLYETLRAQGMQDNQQVTFFTDGGEDIRDLLRCLNPEAEHYLDWFHITMRLTVLRQMTRSLPELLPDQDEVTAVPVTVSPVEADRTLERVKHFLWHGNTFRALDLLGDLADDFECLAEPSQRQQAFQTRLAEFCGYITINAAQIPNYGERRRCDEPVSIAIAESTVNQVISKRMVKKQQMRWSQRGAHLLLQLRTRVLNTDLADGLARWYTGFVTADQPGAVAACSPRPQVSRSPDWSDMVQFLTAAFGGFFGALFGFLSAMLLARWAERQAVTNQLVWEFFSDEFLAHRIKVDQLWRRVRAGEVTAEQVAPGFWYPGQPDYYTGEHDGVLNAHHHLEAYLGHIGRLAYALRNRRLDRKAARAALGMHLLWHDALVQQVAEATACQARDAKAPVPEWTIGAHLLHSQLVISAATIARPR